MRTVRMAGIMVALLALATGAPEAVAVERIHPPSADFNDGKPLPVRSTA